MSAAEFAKSRLSRLHDTMNGHVTRGELSGFVALVCRRGEVHVAANGNHAVGGSKPMQRDTLFRIASMTKPITAVATMILIEEGKLRESTEGVRGLLDFGVSGDRRLTQLFRTEHSSSAI